jgi:hypothetical protein
MSNANQAELFKVCREITEELRRYPGAQLFNEPVKLEHNQSAKYYKKIKNPQDLGSILERLNRGEYTDIKNWERDIATIWSNADIYNGKDSYVSVIAHHMAKRFAKLKERLELKKISGWMKHLYLWREKLDRLLLSPPSGVGPIFPIGRITPASDYAPLTPHELDCLVEASRAFFKAEDVTQVAKILAGESQLAAESDDMVINVDLLAPKTLCRLREYFKKRLQQMGQTYPV